MQILDRPSLFNRSDTFFGVCQGIGEDLGIHPNIFRLAFAGLLFWNPAAALSGYACAGLLVLATRLLFPEPIQQPAEPDEAPASGATAAEEKEERLPLAA